MLRFTHIPHEFESNAFDSSHVKKCMSSLCWINAIDMSLEKQFFFVPYGAQTQLITHKRIALFRHFVVKSRSMPSYVTNSQPLFIINKLRFFVIYSMKNEASPSFVWRAYAYHSVSVSVAQGAPLHQDNITKPFIRANAVSF